MFVVMIGLMIGGRARLGVLFQPISLDLWRGRVFSDGTGLAEKVYGTDVLTEIRVAPRFPTTLSGLRCAVSASKRPPMYEFMSAACGGFVDVAMGSVGLKIALVAEGSADIFFTDSKGLCAWDTCGPVAIVLAAGTLPRPHAHAIRRTVAGETGPPQRAPRIVEPDASPGDRQYRRGVYMHWQRTFLHPMLAGFDGTLAPRYRGGASLPAAGRVRAKTGTLHAVSALAGGDHGCRRRSDAPDRVDRR
jgi:hypothetical protein